MVFSFSHFHETVADEACGLTFDWQKLPDGSEVCQWLWGKPVSGVELLQSDQDLLAIGESVAGVSRKLNLSPIDPAQVGMNLPNETAILDNCPFRPETCLGRHIVASGTGQISK